MNIDHPLLVFINTTPKPGKIASIVGKDFRSKSTLRKRLLVPDNTKSIQYISSSLSTTPNFTIPSPSSDMDYSSKEVSIDNNQLPPIIDLKLDKNFDKNIDISNEGTSFDQDQTTIKEMFRKMGDRATCGRMTERAVSQICEFFLHFPKQMSIDDKIKLRGLFVGLRQFQALGILPMFNIEIVTNSEGILADEMGFGQVLILLLFSHLLI